MNETPKQITATVCDQNTPKTLAEACAEIERLRDQVARLKENDKLISASYEKDVERLHSALRLCIARAGLPDPLDACRAVIRTAVEALL